MLLIIKWRLKWRNKICAETGFKSRMILYTSLYSQFINETKSVFWTTFFSNEQIRYVQRMQSVPMKHLWDYITSVRFNMVDLKPRDVETTFAAYIMVYSDNSQTTMKTSRHIFYMLHILIINEGHEWNKVMIFRWITILGPLPTQLFPNRNGDCVARQLHWQNMEGALHKSCYYGSSETPG